MAPWIAGTKVWRGPLLRCVARDQDPAPTFTDHTALPMAKQPFHLDLTDKLYDAEEEGTVDEINENYGTPLKTSMLDKQLLEKVPAELVRAYTKHFNGCRIDWRFPENDAIGGRVHLLPFEDIVRDGLGTTYEEEDLTENELVQYFKPFDLVTDEMECGFLMDPGFTSRSIHYKRAGAPHLYDLDIDMKGYLELVVATGGFFHWPKVLVDIQEGTESAETEQFREYMPRIFSGFTWRAFVAQYTGLRIG